jgi:hypothetical protein
MAPSFIRAVIGRVSLTIGWVEALVYDAFPSSAS